MQTISRSCGRWGVAAAVTVALTNCQRSEALMRFQFRVASPSPSASLAAALSASLSTSLFPSLPHSLPLYLSICLSVCLLLLTAALEAE